MLISELAEKVGLNPQTIRRLERKGAIPAAKRDLNGWRHYSADTVAKLRKLYVRLEGPGENELRS